ncbi:hypothetical protein MHTCC0001_25270 [Flavobacteriaceae bacterium MHTCC 0001]
MKKDVSKMLRVLLIVFAFALTSNVSATTATTASYGWKWKKKKSKKKKKWKKKYKKPCKGDKVPLDAGLGVLVLGAAAFGARKLRNKQ